MTIETAEYDLVYGRLLKIGIAIDKAKLLAKVLIDVNDKIGTNINDLLKNVDQNGLRYDNAVYGQLNKARTNSSQIGYMDRTNIPPAILQQFPNFGARIMSYVDMDYVDPDYVE